MRETAEARKKRLKAERRANLQKARADAFFIIYYDFGPERSLEKLHGHLADLGLKHALNTLKNYSVKYNWQQRLIEEEERQKERWEFEREQRRHEREERHTRAGKNLQAIGLAGMLAYSKAIEKGEELRLSPAELTTLTKTGQDLELRALGEPTLRVEVTTVLYNVMIARIGHIFMEANKLPSQQARADYFGIHVDEIQELALREANLLAEPEKQ